MKSVITLLITAFFLVPASLPAANEAPAGRAAPFGTKAVQDNGTGFALSLYRRLSISEDNLFLSPSSIETALSMTMSGARGRTESQMADVLGIAMKDRGTRNREMLLQENRMRSIEKKGRVTISQANSLFPQKGFKLSPSWLRDISHFYGATITPVNYLTETEKTRLAINRWVEARTKNRIRELIKPGILDALTRLSLVNAVYFKGEWETPFKKENSFESPFLCGKGNTVSTSMMHQTGSFRFAAPGSVQLLELPYSGKDLAMLVVLPGKGVPLSTVENSLDEKKLAEWNNLLGERKVEVFLPRFRETASFRLDKVLKEMGMTDAFSQRFADFSGMVQNRKELYIGAVVHKAFVEVNEKGTEAAAATAVIMQLKSAMPEPLPVFRADRPFLFMIRDTSTGRILFIGRLNDPSERS
ncbi:MAG: serpin family protein [Chlorobiaceae bacterium]|nr:serpin family protein [Chlorobiaceae bacterium]